MHIIMAMFLTFSQQQNGRARRFSKLSRWEKSRENKYNQFHEIFCEYFFHKNFTFRNMRNITQKLREMDSFTDKICGFICFDDFFVMDSFKFSDPTVSFDSLILC